MFRDRERGISVINPKASEWLVQRDTKSLLAGIVYGQGMKGRARAAQNPVPAGFPQELWNAATQRANAVIASMATGGQSGETPETPSDWQFDSEAFQFGVAAGRVLEGWEIDGGLLMPRTMVKYYIRLESSDTVRITFRLYWDSFPFNNRTAYIIWGDESGVTMAPSDRNQPSHFYENGGDYIITVISASPLTVENSEFSSEMNHSYAGVYIDKPGGVYCGSDEEAILTPLRAVCLYGEVREIANSAFQNCVNLTDVTDLSKNTSGTLYSWVGANAFKNCSSLVSVTIADDICRQSIGTYAFCNCASLANVTIPDSVISIGDYAFKNCASLASVTIPDAVTRVRYQTFCNCTSLTSVTIPEGVTAIESAAFYGCSALTNVEIPSGVTIISDSVFRKCASLSGITIPNGATSIEQYAFKDSGLTSVTIPDSVTSIGRDAFNGCGRLTSVTILNGVTPLHISGYAGAGSEHGVSGISGLTFGGCASLTNITIPGRVQGIPWNAFFGCVALTNVTICEGVSLIGYKAFENCPNLRTVTLPASLTLIGYDAFGHYLRGPLDLYYAGTYEQWWAINPQRAYTWEYVNNCVVHYNSAGPDNAHND